MLDALDAMIAAGRRRIAFLGGVGSIMGTHDYPEDIRTFKTCAYYLPLAGIVASLVVFLLAVKIDENMHDHIVEQLEERLASEETDKQ